MALGKRPLHLLQFHVLAGVRARHSDRAGAHFEGRWLAQVIAFLRQDGKRTYQVSAPRISRRLVVSEASDQSACSIASASSDIGKGYDE